MDLVISVDTSIAHLAGALAIPLWLLISDPPEYRWLLGRDDSPWYPTARLYRQAARGDWSGVIERVVAALADSLLGGGPPHAAERIPAAGRGVSGSIDAEPA
jgi:ADP-heptose:LPS heptosyltransferase